MGKAPEININFNQIAGFQSFLKSLDAEMRKTHLERIGSSRIIAQTMTRFVRQELKDMLNGHRFGEFMAERTALDIVPTQKGFTITIRGLTEKELYDMGLEEESKYDPESAKDYNLWELYEFHGGDYIKAGDSAAAGRVKAIQKDTGSTLQFRTKTGDIKTMDTRKGLVQSIVSQIRPAFKAAMTRLVQSYAASIVAQAAENASKKPATTNRPLELKGSKPKRKAERIPGLTAKLARERKIKVADLNQEIIRAGGVEVADVGKFGQRIRASSGRFIKVEAFTPVRQLRIGKR